MIKEDALPLPLELILHIASFFNFKDQVFIFTILNKNIRQLVEQVIISNVMKQSISNPIFKQFHPSTILFENAIEQIALQKNYNFLKEYPLVRSLSEFCFVYCQRFTPSVVKLSKTIFSNWKLKFQTPIFDESSLFTSEQCCGLCKDSNWFNFYFPSIGLKAVAGVSYWFSFLLKDYQRNVGKNIWKIILGVAAHETQLSDFKLFSYSPFNYGLIVGTGEKISGMDSERHFTSLQFQSEDVITFAMEFFDDSRSIYTIGMRLKVFCNLKPLGILFSQHVSANGIFHPICALCEATTIVFRMDGISTTSKNSQV